MTTRVQHDVADLALASHGINRVEWADRSMPVLRAIRERFAAQRPFDGVRIAACLNITAETANLVRTLQAGGAEIRLCASNPLSTQDDTAAALVSEYGVSVFARHRSDTVTYREHLDAVLARPPALVLDDACDLATALHSDYQDLLPGLRGGCEETTSGVVRLRAMASADGLRYPVVAVTDTPTKNLVDNRIGTGQSTIDALLRSTNTLIAGANVVVAGFGDGGQGVAARLTGLGARVIVTEVDPGRALDATLHGYPVLSMNEAAKLGDIFITVTGNRDVIRAEHMALMKDGAVLANAGHFDLEIDVVAMATNAVERRVEVRPHVDEYVQPDGRRLLLVAEGRVVNLAGAEGHPAGVMDIAFGIQALSAEWLLRTDPGALPMAVLDVPPGIDREVARLKLAALGVTLDVLTEVQAEYLTSWSAPR